MVRRGGSSGEGADTTPRALPATTPPSYGADQHSWLLQSVMEMQKSVGQLTQAVSTLTEQVKKQGDKLDTISHRMYAAGVVIAGMLAVGGYFMTTIVQAFIAAIKASP